MVYREANRCADGLASIGCRGQLHLREFEQIPTDIAKLFADDRGTSFPRLVYL